MVIQSDLKKPMQPGTLRKPGPDSAANAGPPCPSCGSTERMLGVLGHKRNCELYAANPCPHAAVEVGGRKTVCLQCGRTLSPTGDGGPQK